MGIRKIILKSWKYLGKIWWHHRNCLSHTTKSSLTQKKIVREELNRNGLVWSHLMMTVLSHFKHLESSSNIFLAQHFFFSLTSSQDNVSSLTGWYKAMVNDGLLVSSEQNLSRDPAAFKGRSICLSIIVVTTNIFARYIPDIENTSS